MPYTASDLRAKLISRHGRKLDFLFKEFDKRGFEFKVEDLWLRNFDGTSKGAYVKDNAPDLDTAAGWAMDALREWAGLGLSGSGNYFGEITREWASHGDGEKDVPACVGSTIDWAYLFSSNANGRLVASADMYQVAGGNKPDLFNLICWVFADKLDAVVGFADAKVNKPSTLGLNKRWWDCDPRLPVIPNDSDQTHHFAGYFWFGANVGTSTSLMRTALSGTTDWSIVHQKVINQGDYDLGFLGAQWGERMKDKPGFIGKAVESDLRTGINSASGP